MYKSRYPSRSKSSQQAARDDSKEIFIPASAVTLENILSPLLWYKFESPSQFTTNISSCPSLS
jgi:hypothetical protein